jgi:KEOPS complex subunit Pcc1
VTDDPARRNVTADGTPSADRDEGAHTVGAGGKADRGGDGGGATGDDTDTDEERAGVADRPGQPHGARLSLPGGRRGRLVTDAIAVEEGEMPDDRSRARVRPTGRDGDQAGDHEVSITAADLVALRAASNTWLRLVDVAERVVDLADAPGAGTTGDGAASGRTDDPDATDERDESA